MFRWKKNRNEEKIEPREKETIQLSNYDTLRQRCASAWTSMGFVNDRGGMVSKMEHVFSVYEKLDKEYEDMFKPTHLHKKGRYYEVVAEGIIEENCIPAVIYKNDMGIIWIRPSEEFYDGRFTPIEELEKDDVSNET